MYEAQVKLKNETANSGRCKVENETYEGVKKDSWKLTLSGTMYDRIHVPTTLVCTKYVRYLHILPFADSEYGATRLCA